MRLEKTDNPRGLPQLDCTHMTAALALWPWISKTEFRLIRYEIVKSEAGVDVNLGVQATGLKKAGVLEAEAGRKCLLKRGPNHEVFYTGTKEISLAGITIYPGTEVNLDLLQEDKGDEPLVNSYELTVAYAFAQLTKPGEYLSDLTLLRKKACLGAKKILEHIGNLVLKGVLVKDPKADSWAISLSKVRLVKSMIVELEKDVFAVQGKLFDLWNPVTHVTPEPTESEPKAHMRVPRATLALARIAVSAWDRIREKPTALDITNMAEILGLKEETVNSGLASLARCQFLWYDADRDKWSRGHGIFMADFKGQDVEVVMIAGRFIYNGREHELKSLAPVDFEEDDMLIAVSTSHDRASIITTPSGYKIVVGVVKPAIAREIGK